MTTITLLQIKRQNEHLLQKALTIAKVPCISKIFSSGISDLLMAYLADNNINPDMCDDSIRTNNIEYKNTDKLITTSNNFYMDLIDFCHHHIGALVTLHKILCIFYMIFFLSTE